MLRFGFQERKTKAFIYEPSIFETSQLKFP